MHMHVCACMHVSAPVCACTCLYVYVCVCAQVYMSACANTCVCVFFVRSCVCMCSSEYMYTCICVCACMYVPVTVCARTSMCLCVCAGTQACVCFVCVCRHSCISPVTSEGQNCTALLSTLQLLHSSFPLFCNVPCSLEWVAQILHLFSAFDQFISLCISHHLQSEAMLTRADSSAGLRV